jgi:hypothetical protein
MPATLRIERPRDSGLMLVPKRKRRASLASIREYAKADFKPWPREPGESLFPSNEQMCEAAAAARMAYAIMLKTKEELIEVHRKR